MVKLIAIAMLSLVGCVAQVATSEFDPVQDEDASEPDAGVPSQEKDAGVGEVNTQPCMACCTEGCRSSNQELWHPTPLPGGAHSFQ